MEPDIDIRLENESLKREFLIRDLDLDVVWSPDEQCNMELENRQLHLLLGWVDKYNQLGDREMMLKEGYSFPPIFPCIDPVSDWNRFELWMRGEPISFKLPDVVPTEFFFENADELSDDELKNKLKKLTDFLDTRNLSVDIGDEIPERALYEHLLEVIKEEYDYPVECGFYLDGCEGFCPACFQRPWCDTGVSLCWPEDEDAGEMCITDSTKKFLSPSKISLSILREKNKNEEKTMKDFMDEPLPDDFTW